jgi:hypothetical protein
VTGISSEKVLIGVFVAVEGAHAFSAFMPSYFTIGAFVRTPEDLRALRSGYAPATLFNLALGGVTALLVKSAWPFLLSTGICGLMIGAYERAIRQNVLPPSSGAAERVYAPALPEAT